jgi:hypothetical protein
VCASSIDWELVHLHLGDKGRKRTVDDTLCRLLPAVHQTGCRGHTDMRRVVGLQEIVCFLLVLNSVTSTPQWIRQLEPRDMHYVCVFVCKCVYVVL